MTQNLDFKIFEGPNNREMPKLIATGLVPASAAQIMYGRLERKLSFVKYYDSGDAIVYHPDGRVKLVWDSQDLRELNLGSPLVDGALVLPAGAWTSIGGEEFSKEEIAKYAGQEQSKNSAKGNPFWKWLARGDKDLLGEYADQLFSHVKQRSGHDEAMDVYLNDLQKDVTVLRLWCLGGVDYDGGNAYGYVGLDYYDGRLAGVLETQGVSRPENQRFSVGSAGGAPET